MKEDDAPREDTAQPDDAAPDEGKDENETEGEAKKEFGGRKGPEPTRYGDWENKGICTDF